MLHSWQGPFNRRFASDVAVNIALYVPLGVSARWAFRRMRGWQSAALALAAGTLLSASIEMVQLYTPGRSCSGFDLLDNIIGTAFGIVTGITFVGLRGRRVSGDRAAAALFCVWVASLLFPLFPVTRLTMFRDEVAAFSHEPFALLPFVLSAMTWCAAGRLLSAAATNRTSRFFGICLLFIPLQFAIVTRAPLPATAAGAVCGWLLFVAFGSRKSAWKVFSAAFCGLLIWHGLTPFHFTAANAFVWIPFGGSLRSAQWQDGFRVIVEKVFLYGTGIWLLCDSWMKLPHATFAIAGLLTVIEVLQIGLPGHIPEITDPLVAVLLGVAIGTQRKGRAAVA